MVQMVEERKGIVDHGRISSPSVTVRLSLCQSIVGIDSTLMFVSCFMVILSLNDILYLFDGALHLLKLSTCELAKCEFMVECYNLLLYLPTILEKCFYT